jgi:hypothetical protein
MTQSIPRRNLLQMGVGATAVAGTAFVLGTDGAGAADTVRTYLLDADPSPAHCRVPVPARTKHQQHVERQAVKKARVDQARQEEERARLEAEQRDAALPPEERAKKEAEQKAEDEQKAVEAQARQQAEDEARRKAEQPGLSPEEQAKLDAELAAAEAARREQEAQALTPEEAAKQQSEQAAREAEEQAAAKKAADAAGGCAACSACRKHSENKVFATKEAADRERAHKGCKCTIVDGPRLSRTVFDALFADNPRQSVDRRDPKVADLLANPDAEGVPVPILAPAAPVLLALAGGAWWWHSRRNDRAAAAEGPDGPEGPTDTT